MSDSDIAQKIFLEGFNCAQSVLSAFSGKYGVGELEARKIACGFGAGCGRQSLTCGAVSGALMVIGLKYGKVEADDEQAKETTYTKIDEFINKFKDKFSTVNCYELLGCDLETDEGRKYYSENDMFHNECLGYVKAACNILNEMGL